MEIMTLAQRKAAKKSNLINQELNTTSSITVEEAIKAIAPIAPIAPIIAAAAHESVVGALKADALPVLSAQDILALAAKHGLKLQAPKKEFVKHTYSVTTDSKALFKKYCDVLGINMQDAMEEALQGFFKKHALEYTRVKEAKNA